MKYINIGIDLGQTIDFTALVGLIGNNDSRYVACADRYKQMHYITMMENCAKRIRQMKAKTVFGDATGGASSGIFDMLNPLIEEPVKRVKIVGSGEFHIHNGFLIIPKQVLINKLILDYQNRAILVPEELKMASVITHELKNYKYDVSKAGNWQYNARDGEHDDLVIALALANFGFRQADFPCEPSFQSRYSKVK